MNELIRRPLARFALALGATAIIATNAFAAFPEKPVRLIVPFAAGGGTDAIARTLAVGMGHSLAQPVIVENKPGAGTIIGSDYVAKSPPDGYTLVVATFAHAVNPSLMPHLPFDTEKAFAPVVLLARGPNVLIVRADSPYRSVQDVLAAARARPGKLTYASQGNGTSAHLAGELFDSLANVHTTHIPYKGAGPAMTDLMGGQVDFMFATAAAAKPQVAGGKLRALAVTTPTRSDAFKDVPAIAEIVPGYAVESWYALFAPAGTPPDVVARLHAAARKAMEAPEFRNKLEPEGLTVSGGSAEELDAYVRSEQARWSKVVKDNKIKVD